MRTMSISGAFAFATSVAARTDSLHTATHQVCLQVWLAASLLADALAVAAQSLIARYLSSDDTQVQAKLLLGILPALLSVCCSDSILCFQSMLHNRALILRKHSHFSDQGRSVPFASS